MLLKAPIPSNDSRPGQSLTQMVRSWGKSQTFSKSEFS
jgi:hypothetical protein